MTFEGENKTKNMLERLVEMLEKDSRGFQFFTYGVTGIGLLTALYRIRPFAKFSDPTKVPTRFIKSQTILQGTVQRIEPGKTPLLMVDHRPLVNIPKFGKCQYLPVKIAGVNVTNHGISWLSTVVQGKKIEFIPVEKSKNYLDCTVTMPQEKEEPLAVGKELVRLGFGIVTDLPSDPNDKTINSYKKSLKTAQDWAKLRRNGQWHFTIPPTIWWKIKNNLSEKLSVKI